MNDKYADKLNDFSQYLRDNSHLSEASIGKYVRGARVTSEEMLEAHVIFKSIFEMDSFEMEIAILSIFNNPDFYEKNKKGNNMYSNALKWYKNFLGNYAETSPEIEKQIEKIRVDKTIQATERDAIIKARIGQGEFRNSLLEKYEHRCIITGVSLPQLLVASHIKPWSVSNNDERLSQSNGLLLSATYDRLFDSGLMTFKSDGKVYFSNSIKDNNKEIVSKYGNQFDIKCDTKMKLFLEYHQDKIFIR